MDPKHQVDLGSGGEYTPTQRAAAGMKAGQGGGGTVDGKPITGTGPMNRNEVSSADKEGVDQNVSQDVASSPPPQSAQHGYIEPGDTKKLKDTQA